MLLGPLLVDEVGQRGGDVQVLGTLLTDLLVGEVCGRRRGEQRSIRCPGRGASGREEDCQLHMNVGETSACGG